MSKEDVQSFIDHPLELNVSSHTVQTERMIREVDNVASRSASDEVCEGIIRSRLLDRQNKPKLSSKSDMIST